MNFISLLKKRLSSMSSLLNRKEKNAQDCAKSEQCQNSIVFVNTPIHDSDSDVLFYSPQADAISTAVSKGANLIGIIADYGAGKTSLTEILCSLSNARDPIRIHLWDTITTAGNSSKLESTNAVSDITKTFLYQLALGNNKKDIYARNISWRLSRNYGLLSLTPTNGKFYFWIITAFLFYTIPIVLLASYAQIEGWLKLLLDFSSPWLAIAFASIGIMRTNIAFSLWDSQGKRQPETSDSYSIFTEIVKAVFTDKTKRYVFIEDLDRIHDKTVVIEFLKEVYKFCSNLKGKYKERVVFIISVMPEYKLTANKKERDYGSHLYSKIFDFITVLPSVHIHDHETVLLDILRTNADLISNCLGEELNDKTISSFAWIIKGENLTVRDIKNRLNMCFSIFERLNKRQNSNEKLDIQLAKCAVVAYLIDRYPQYISCLVQSEIRFDSLVSLSTQKNAKRYFGNSSIEESTDDLKNLLEKIMIENCWGEANQHGAAIPIASGIEDDSAVENSDDTNRKSFVEDIVTLLTSSLIADDFHQYFYTYPKNSRILKVHEQRVKTLLLGNGTLTDDLMADISKIRQSSNEVIISPVRFLIDLKTGLPTCVFQCKDLFEVAFEEFSNDVIEEISRILNWEKRKLESSKALLDFLENTVDAKYHQTLFEHLAKLLVVKIENESVETISFFRQVMVPILGADMIYMAQMYHETNMPLIQPEEMALVRDYDRISVLTNIGLIDDNSAIDIAKWIAQPYVTQDYEKLDEIIEKCLSTNIKTAGNALEYMRANSRYKESIFLNVLSSDMCRAENIVEYLNSISPALVSIKGWDMIESRMIFGGYNQIVRKWLISKRKYKAYLLDVSSEDIIQESLLQGLDEKLFGSAMRTIFNQYPDRFVRLRNLMPVNYMRLNPGLFRSPYPIIGDRELQKCTCLDMAIALIDFAELSGVNCKYVATHLSRLSIGKRLCRKLFDEVLTNDQIAVDIRSEIYEAIDFSTVPFSSMPIPSQEACLANIRNNIIEITTVLDALNTMKHLFALVTSLEQFLADEDTKTGLEANLFFEYIQLVLQLKYYSDITIKICRKHRIKVPMWEDFEQELLANNDQENYLISFILRTKTFSLSIIQDMVKIEFVANVLSNVPECQKYIRADNKCMTKLMGTPEAYRTISKNAIWFFQNYRQKTLFIKYAFSLLDDSEKYRYISNMADLDTLEDDRQFFSFMCEENNLRIAAENNEFKYRVGFRLYGGENSKRKNQYYRLVKQYKDKMKQSAET